MGLIGVRDRPHSLDEAPIARWAWRSQTLCDPIIADAQVPGVDGRALVRDLAAHGPMPRVILLCPRAGRTLESEGITCLTEPIDLGALHQLLARFAAGSPAA